MNIRHNSRLAEYRSPFGAVVIGTTVELSIRVDEIDPKAVTAKTRIWVDGVGETIIDMDHKGDGFFSASIECDKPQLKWYSFIVSTQDGYTCHVGAPVGATGGEAVTYDYADVPSFQITVYKHRATRPAWYEKGMVYQIFPDRYRRDANWRERAVKEVEKPRKGPGKKIVWDWNTPPVYDRASDNSIQNWDFYGGSLEGIREDLPRLHEMGITAIYLNPIFKALSNHRYDTGDYLTIDPMLGTEDDFKALAKDAKELGISLILDGVFGR